MARRYAGLARPEIVIEETQIDLATKGVTVRGKAVTLTAREWAVLERLLSRRGGIVAKSDIEQSLYAFGAEIESNTVEVYVSRLRKKIGRKLITTVRGLGYKIE